ncbi:MAG: hypothetical protein IPL61_22085 [Myxococcales bacterium]|nr:hypothetical protein [Myxococcales bacterium]
MSLARRVLTIALALAAAAGFAMSVEGGRWWSLGPDIHVGPISTERCFGGDCQFSTLAWTGGSGAWERVGIATYAGGLCAALVCLALAGSLAARRPGRLAAAVTAIATITAGAAAAGFYLLRPDIPGGTTGRGALLFAGAVAAAAAAAVATLTVKRADPSALTS